MSASNSINGQQFEFVYSPPEMGANYHSIRVPLETDPLGRVRSAEMNWDAKRVRGIEVPAQFQRQGIATAMWNEATRLAEESSKIPTPKHSSDRTDAGDAWARSVGGKLPRRKKLG